MAGEAVKPVSSSSSSSRDGDEDPQASCVRTGDERPGQHADSTAMAGTGKGGEPVWPAAVVLFLHTLAFSLANPLYCDVLLLDPGVLSQVTPRSRIAHAQMLLSIAAGLNAFFELVTAGTVGVLCDRIGRRPLAVLSQVGQFVDFSIAAFCAPSLSTDIDGYHFPPVGAAVIAARCFAGICGSIKVPVQGYCADVSIGGGGARNFGQLKTAAGLGFVAGPLLQLVVMKNTGKLRLALGLAACVHVVNILIICCAWKRSVTVEKVSWREANPYWLVRSTIMRTKRLQVFGCMNFLDEFALILMMSTIPLFTTARYGWDPSRRSVYFLLIGIFTPIQMFGVMRPLLKHKGDVFVLKLGYIASCSSYAAMFLLGLTDVGVAFYATTVVYTLGLISNPAQLSMAVRELPAEEYGRLCAGLTMLEVLGKALAPMFGGMLFGYGMEVGMPSLVYLVATAVLLPGVVMAFRIQAWDRAKLAADGAAEAAAVAKTASIDSAVAVLPPGVPRCEERGISI